MEQTEERTGVSRRKVVAGVAWTVPAIIAASALPAYAASKKVTTVSVASFTGTTPVATFRFATSDTTDVKKGTTATFTVIATRENSGSSLTGTASTGEGFTVSPPALSTVGEVDTFTFTVTVNTDQPNPFNITFTLSGVAVASASAAVSSASTTPASNGSVSYSTAAINWA